MNEITGPQSVSANDLFASPGEAPQERADAARNRQRILAAAQRLFAKNGVAAVSMDQVAAEAGVGKGTVFRRFGDKAGLAVGLLDEAERELQQRVIAGPPPMGPGAPPQERLVAFLDAYLDFLGEHLELVHMSETSSPGARYRVGSYRFWHRHVGLLLHEADPNLDAEYLAHALLAPLAADLHTALIGDVSRSRIRTATRHLASAVLKQA